MSLKGLFFIVNRSDFEQNSYNINLFLNKTLPFFFFCIHVLFLLEPRILLRFALTSPDWAIRKLFHLLKTSLALFKTFMALPWSWTAKRADSIRKHDSVFSSVPSSCKVGQGSVEGTKHLLCVQWVCRTLRIINVGWPPSAAWIPVDVALIKCYVRQNNFIWYYPLSVRLIRVARCVLLRTFTRSWYIIETRTSYFGRQFSMGPLNFCISC